MQKLSLLFLLVLLVLVLLLLLLLLLLLIIIIAISFDVFSATVEDVMPVVSSLPLSRCTKNRTTVTAPAPSSHNGRYDLELQRGSAADIQIHQFHHDRISDGNPGMLKKNNNNKTGNAVFLMVLATVDEHHLDIY